METKESHLPTGLIINAHSAVAMPLPTYFNCFQNGRHPFSSI